MRVIGKLVDIIALVVSIWMMYETIQGFQPEDVKRTKQLERQLRYVRFCRDTAEHFGRKALEAEKRYYEMVGQ